MLGSTFYSWDACKGICMLYGVLANPKVKPGTRKGPNGRTPQGTLQLSGHALKSIPGAIADDTHPPKAPCLRQYCSFGNALERTINLPPKANPPKRYNMP